MTDDGVSYTLPCEPPSAGDLCAFAEVTIESVCSMLSRLNPLKDPGPDGILPFLLKSFASVLAPSFDPHLQQVSAQWCCTKRLQEG